MSKRSFKRSKKRLVNGKYEVGYDRASMLKLVLFCSDCGGERYIAEDTILSTGYDTSREFILACWFCPSLLRVEIPWQQDQQTNTYKSSVSISPPKGGGF